MLKSAYTKAGISENNNKNQQSALKECEEDHTKTQSQTFALRSPVLKQKQVEKNSSPMQSGDEESDLEGKDNASKYKWPPPLVQNNKKQNNENDHNESASTSNATIQQTAAAQSTSTAAQQQTAAAQQHAINKAGIPANTVPLIQSGIDRYVHILKRKRSPRPNDNKASKLKKNQQTQNNTIENRFAILAEEEKTSQPIKSYKPPPIYLREKNSSALVNNLTQIIGKDKFHVVSVRKGKIEETKVVIYEEKDYRKVVKSFDEATKNYYTYQLKSSKGLVVVLRGIEHEVDPNEIKEALETQGFNIKMVLNIKNRKGSPTPLFRVELEPDTKKLKSNEPHKIYSLQYLLHRKISVEAPNKRKSPLQCSNCQEFGHSKTYCTLRTVCVACGDFHPTKDCPKDRNDPSAKKCSNCEGNHTANYRGCPVFIAKKRSLHTPLRPRTQSTEFAPQQTQPNFPSAPQFPTESYANILKGNTQNTETQNGPQSLNLEYLIKILIQNMVTMQNLMQDMARNQQTMLQLLRSRP